MIHSMIGEVKGVGDLVGKLSSGNLESGNLETPIATKETSLDMGYI